MSFKIIGEFVWDLNFSKMSYGKQMEKPDRKKNTFVANKFNCFNVVS